MGANTYIIDPMVSVGPFKFGMTKAEVATLTTSTKNKFHFDEENRLFRVTLNDEPENLVLKGINLSRLSALDAMLAIVRQSKNVGLQMGGRLHFFDLGMEVGDWEHKYCRVFSFFNYEDKEYAGTSQTDSLEIIDYYFDGMGYDGEVCDISYLYDVDPPGPIETPSYKALFLILGVFIILLILGTFY